MNTGTRLDEGASDARSSSLSSPAQIVRPTGQRRRPRLGAVGSVSGSHSW